MNNDDYYRESEFNQLQELLTKMSVKNSAISFGKGIYVYGEPGIGKTKFVINSLNELGYDIVRFDIAGINDKSFIETIQKNNMSDRSAISMLQRCVKKIIIVIDNIDCTCNIDKSSISGLMKMIRPKKTKKQLKEEISTNPIICVGNITSDKKIKELLGVCHSILLKPFCPSRIYNIINKFATINGIKHISDANITNMVNYVGYDLRKLNTMINMYNNTCMWDISINNTFIVDTHMDNNKIITSQLFSHAQPIQDHSSILNEPDRTIIGLMWHENIADIIDKLPVRISIPLYNSILTNICFADFIDRVTFQKQIWQFNEMSSIMKTFHTNFIFHTTCSKLNLNIDTHDNIRFTKVLTKYSTEYNNNLFLQMMCQKLGMDKKDTISFFIHTINRHNFANDIFGELGITKLDSRRMHRYITGSFVDASKSDKNSEEIDTIINDICAEDIDIDIDRQSLSEDEL
jgi:SpoVK/Ycf46/Vps4 family AAA+-type ATPase